VLSPTLEEDIGFNQLKREVKHIAIDTGDLASTLVNYQASY